MTKEQLAASAAIGIVAALAGCQDAQSPNSVTPTSADGGPAQTHEMQVREPSEKHSCGDHGH